MKSWTSNLIGVEIPHPIWYSAVPRGNGCLFGKHYGVLQETDTFPILGEICGGQLELYAVGKSEIVGLSKEPIVVKCDLCGFSFDVAGSWVAAVKKWTKIALQTTLFQFQLEDQFDSPLSRAISDVSRTYYEECRWDYVFVNLRELKDVVNSGGLMVVSMPFWMEPRVTVARVLKLDEGETLKHLLTSVALMVFDRIKDVRSAVEQKAGELSSVISI
mgnify:CR=1 FL=1